jgi:hypothetical protein
VGFCNFPYKEFHEVVIDLSFGFFHHGMEKTNPSANQFQGGISISN